jgi:serine phosphatase RsbU (regulator of sigma subunit)
MGLFWNRKGKDETPSPEGAPPGPAPAKLEPDMLSSGTLRTHRDALLAAIAWVSESDDTDSMLERIVDSSIEVTRAERGFLILPDANGQLVVRVARGRNKQPLVGEPKYSTGIVKRVLSDSQPLNLTVTNESEALEIGNSVLDLGLRAAMCVPLLTGGSGGSAAERGVLYVDSKLNTRRFHAEDLQTFVALSGQLRIALEKQRLHDDRLQKKRLEEERRIMGEIQQDLMPEIPRNVPGWDIFGWYRPAEGTTGDFYDFIPLKGQRLAMLLGDASGHGVGPSLIATAAQSALRSTLKLTDDLPRAVSLLNEDIGPRMDDGRFCTMFASVLHADGSVWMVNAGHPPALLWRARDGSVESFGNHGPALGMIDEFEFTESTRMQMQAGDVLIVLSDGILEAERLGDRSALFGEQGVLAVLQRHAAEGASAKALTEALIREVQAFTGGKVQDDLTVMAVRRIVQA